MHLRLFGIVEIRHGRESETPSRFQTCLAGLVFGHGLRGASRAAITAHLWDEEPDRAARHRLSQLVYNLGKRIGVREFARWQGDRLVPDPEAVDCDVLELEESGDRFLRRLEDPLRSWDFLGSVEDAPTAAMEHWIERRRGELKGLLEQSARSLYARSVEAGRWPDARRSAEILFRLDPGREDHLRALVEARAICGSAAEAEAAVVEFREHRIASGDEGPWEPSAETRRLLTRTAGPPGPRDGEPEQPVVQDAPLVGRTDELRRMLAFVRDDASPGLQTIVLEGAGGIGKSRLLDELVARLPIQGLRTLRGYAHHLERAIPLSPLIDALTSVDLRRNLRAIGEPWGAVLRALAPALIETDDDPTEPPYLQPDRLPHRLFAAIFRLLENVAQEERTLLVLDDLHAADETTLAAITFLARRWDCGRLTLAVALRPDTDAGPNLTKLLEALEPADTLRIRLEELGPEAAVELVRRVAGQRVSEAQATGLCEFVGGNPFFLVELALEFVHGHLELTGADVPRLPASVRQLLKTRLERGSSEALETLQLLSVLEEALIEDLALLAGREVRETLETAEELMRLRLCLGEGRRVWIRHPLLRQAVRLSLSEPRRAHLHRIAGEHVLAVRGENAASELAVHFHHAGERERALRYSLTAADHAEGNGTVAEAIRFLLIARKSTDAPDRVSEIVRRLAELNYLHRNLSDAVPLLEMSQRHLRAQGDEVAALVQEIMLCDALSELSEVAQQDCLDRLDEVAAAVRNAGAWDEYARAVDIKLRVLDRMGRLEDVPAIVHELSDLEATVPPEARCRINCILAAEAYDLDPELAVAAADRALALAEEPALQSLLPLALHRATLVAAMGASLHTKAGEALSDRAFAQAERSGDLRTKTSLFNNVGAYYMEIGRHSAAERLFAEASKLFRDAEANVERTVLLLNRGELAFHEGDLQLACEYFRQAYAATPTNTTSLHGSLALAGRGTVCALMGRLEEARRLYSALSRRRISWRMDPFFLLFFESEMARMSGRPEDARPYVTTAIDHLEGKSPIYWIKALLVCSRMENRFDRRRASHLRFRAADEANRHGLIGVLDRWWTT